MVLHPAFTSSPGVVKAAAPNRALVFFGGFAPHAVEGLVRSLRSSHPELELIVLCGGNDKLRATLEASGLCAKVEGVLTPEVIADYMRQCCFVIGKPGAGSGVGGDCVPTTDCDAEEECHGARAVCVAVGRGE